MKDKLFIIGCITYLCMFLGLLFLLYVYTTNQEKDKNLSEPAMTCSPIDSNFAIMIDGKGPQVYICPAYHYGQCVLIDDYPSYSNCCLKNKEE